MIEYKRLLFIPIIFYALLVIYLSDQSQIPYIIKQFEIKDKILHFFGYLYFYLLLKVPIYINLRDKKYFTFYKISLITILLSMIFAITDEIHQGFTPGRDADIFDLIADFAGLIIAFFLTKYIYSKYSR